MQKFDGRVAVVTGGGSGIGLGLARRFAQEGMKLVVADIDQARIDAAVDELTAGGAEALGVVADVSSEDDVQRLADAAVARFGAVHLLVNNAGVGVMQRFGRIDTALWQWMMGVNLWGPILGCKVFLPILEAQDEAHILNTASMAGFIYSPYKAPYSVTKAGVIALTESLYREFALEKPHIGVSALCPAFVDTAIIDWTTRDAADGRGRDIEADLQPAQDKIHKWMTEGQSPTEVAETVMQGLRERKLHIFTHPEWLGPVEQRFSSIIAGKPINTAFTGGISSD